MSEGFRPDDAEQVREAVAWAATEGETLELRGAGTKRGLGRPPEGRYVLDLSGLRGITLYEPEELVMSARAGTPLAEIESALAENRQRLAFEPGGRSPTDDAGGEADAPTAGTIGGAFVCNLSGPRRITAGAARDHLLGVKCVTGRGEAIATGGRVVKNVTGYDLCKLLAGSWGTLAALTEVTFKVVPAGEKTRTVLIYGLEDGAAAEAMAGAAGSPHEVSGLAHLPAVVAARSALSRIADPGMAVTALRLEGHGPSVEYRSRALRDAFAEAGRVEELNGRESRRFWREVGDAPTLLGDEREIVWRLSVPPTAGPATVAEIAAAMPLAACYDWAGGLVWLGLEGDGAGDEVVRAAADRVGGHATLVRAPEPVRARVPVFHPQPPALAALTARIKEGFDPRGILNPGRMYAGM